MNVILYGCTPQPIKIIDRMKKYGQDIKIHGFLDSDKKKWYKKYNGYDVLGGIDEIEQLKELDLFYCNCVTRDPKTRQDITKQIINKGGRLTNIIDPDVDTSFTKLGTGLLIQEMTTLQHGVDIEDNVSIHLGSLISHDVKIGNSAIITFGCHIGGCVTIGEGARIYTGAIILPGIKIGKWATVGAGAVVRYDVPDYCTVVGNPARILYKK